MQEVLELEISRRKINNMSSYKAGDKVEVSVVSITSLITATPKLKGEFIHQDGEMCMIKVSKSHFGKEYILSDVSFVSKIQLISDEVRQKLKQAIEDRKELKFKIDSEEQGRELQEFLLECGIGVSGGGRFICNTSQYGYIHKHPDGALYVCFSNLKKEYKQSDNLEFNLETGEIINPEQEFVDVDIDYSGEIPYIKHPAGGCLTINGMLAGDMFCGWALSWYIFKETERYPERIQETPMEFNCNRTMVKAKADKARFIKANK